MRPVPVVCLLLAFILQLNFLILLSGYPHDEHLDFWMWYELLPHRRHSVCVLLWRLPNDDVPFVYKRFEIEGMMEGGA